MSIRSLLWALYSLGLLQEDFSLLPEPAEVSVSPLVFSRCWKGAGNGKARKVLPHGKWNLFCCPFLCNFPKPNSETRGSQSLPWHRTATEKPAVAVWRNWIKLKMFVSMNPVFHGAKLEILFPVCASPGFFVSCGLHTSLGYIKSFSVLFSTFTESVKPWM